MDVSYTHSCQKDEINWNWNALRNHRYLH